MKKITGLILILLLLFQGFVFSQKPRSSIVYHSITYEIGANWLKEENLFPIVHKGVINGLTYRFEKRGNVYHEVSVSLRYSKVKAKLETERVSQNEQIYLGYCMAYHLIKSEKLSFYLGGNLKYAHSLVEFPVWDESRAYWATSLTLGLSIRLFLKMVHRNNPYL